MHCFVPILLLLTNIKINCTHYNESTNNTHTTHIKKVSNSYQRTNNYKQPLIYIKNQYIETKTINPLPTTNNKHKPTISKIPKQIPHPILMNSYLKIYQRPQNTVHQFITQILQLKQNKNTIQTFINTSLLIHNHTQHKNE